MAINVSVSGETADEVLKQLRGLVPSVVIGEQWVPAGTGQQAQGFKLGEAGGETQGAATETPKGRGRRKASETAQQPAGEVQGAATEQQTTGDGQGASTAQQGNVTVEEPNRPACTVEDVRAALKTLGATEGQGTEAVFALLGEFKVKNATEAFQGGHGPTIVARVNDLLAAAK